jgi:hypothetical protein
MKITIQRIDPVDALGELTQFDVRGRRMYIRCPFHDDGDRPENWSMIVHRTHCYCFGCRKSASHYDVINALRSKNGRNVGETAVPVSINGRRIPTFDELDFVQQTSDLVDDAPMSLAMRPAIATFIERVRDIAAECLLEREDAVDYLRGRMVVDMRRFGYLPSSDRSVASRIDSLSREMGLGDVPMMMGILETNKKDGRMRRTHSHGVSQPGSHSTRSDRVRRRSRTTLACRRRRVQRRVGVPDIQCFCQRRSVLHPSRPGIRFRRHLSARADLSR